MCRDLLSMPAVLVLSAGRNFVTPDPQSPLCCPCRSTELYCRGLCEPCYNRPRRSRARFGGGKEKVKARDHHLFRVCRTPAKAAGYSSFRVRNSASRVFSTRRSRF